MRIGTWNLDHAEPKKRDEDRIETIDRSDCDVIVLTETHDRIRPTGPSYDGVYSESRPYFPTGERWASIWTRLKVLELITTEDPRRTVAALLAHNDRCVLVYGTVLPWHSDIGDALDFRDKRAETIDQHPKYWQEHRRVVTQQTAEWVRLQSQYYNASLVVAGDWNTDLLAGTKSVRYPYGPTVQVEQIANCLNGLGLQIPTRHVADPGTHRDWLIDHIAVPKGVTKVTADSGITSDGLAACSDHPLVCVEWLP